jgi:bacterioferritin-associated ferredoxin
VIVCICNALRERQIVQEVRNGAASVDAVFASFACEPCCNTCIPEMEELVATTQSMPATAPLPPASLMSPMADCR